MDPNGGQLVNEILKKGGKYHPESTRHVKQPAHMTSRFGFPPSEEQDSRQSETLFEEVDAHLPENLSIEHHQ